MYSRRLARSLLWLLPWLASAASAAPTIVSQPGNANTTAQSSASFSITATGSGTLTYQWRRNGFNLAGQTNSTLTFASATRTDADIYDCMVTDTSGSVISGAARLTVAPKTYPTGITRNPAWDVMTEVIGGSGNIVLPIPNTAADAPGGCYIGGSFTTVNGAAQTMLIRLNSLGMVDSTFAPPTLDSTVLALGMQSDGKLIIGGNFFRVNGTLGHSQLVRLQRSGAVDQTFATTVNFNVNALIVQSDNRILIGGSFTNVNGTGINRIARLNADGTLDTTFSVGTGFNNTVNALALDSLGRVLAGGTFSTFNGGGSPGNRLARLTATGGIDTTFAIGTGPDNTVNAIAFDASGNVLVGGNFANFNGSAATRLARVSSGGTLDTSFSTKLGTAVNANSVLSILVQSGGQILIGGSFNANGNIRANLTQIAADGTPDTQVLPVPNALVNSLAFEADGRVLLAGNFSTMGGNGHGRHAYARLKTDLTLDPTSAVILRNANNTVSSIIPLANGSGKMIVAGAFNFIRGAPVPVNLVRFNSNGTLDTSFNAGNTVKTIYVTNPGTGYTSQPTVVISGGGGAGATGSAIFGLGGVTVTATGTGYTSAPSVTFVGGGGSGATAAVSLSGASVSAVLLTNYGTGYTAVPTLTFTGGGGSGAAATTSIGGVLTTISVTNAGSGYTSAPTVTITGGGGSGATALVNVGGIGANNSILSAVPIPDGRIAIAGNFTNYNNAARNRIAIVNADGTLDTSFNSGGIVNAILLTNAGSGYTAVPTVTFTGGGGSGAQATAVLSGNTVSGFVLTNQGNGYTAAPTLSLSSSGGAGATATATIGATGISSTVNTMTLLRNSSIGPTPRLFVGGSFTSVNGTTLNRAAIVTLFGALDTNYTATGATGGADNTVFASAVQTDDQIVLGGSFTNVSAASPARPEIARITQAGTIDSSFFNSGTGFSSNTQVNALAVLGAPTANNGQVVAGGSFTTFNGASVNFAARLTSAGALDASFVPTSGSSTINGLLALEDGSVLVRGNILTAGTTGGAVGLMRLGLNGTRDTSLLAAGFSSTGSTWAPLVMLDDGTIFTANNLTGMAASQAATAPTITVGPSNIAANVGGNVTFTVTASSIAPVTYQWSFNGAPIPAAVGSTYNIPSAQLANVGNYAVTVSNEIGSVVSSTATLSGVNPAPTIISDPVSTQFTVGQTTNATLAVSATGVGTLTYQWRKFGSPIAGATTAVLSLANTKLTDAGLYDVIVADGLSTTLSNPARVTVNPPSYPSGVMRLRPGFAQRIESAQAGGNAVAIDAANNKFYVAGELSRVEGAVRLNIARFNADGTFDSTWVPATIAGNGMIRAMVLDGNGHLVIGGEFTLVNGVSRNRIARLNVSDGSLDTTFDPGTGANGTVFCIALQPNDGKILVGGQFSNVNGTSINRLVRLNTNGAVDGTFAIGTGFNNDVRAIVVQGSASQVDGIFVGGLFTTYNGSSTNATRLVRLTSSGAQDSAANFNTGSGFATDVRALALQSDNKLLVGGAFTSYNGNTTTAVRLVRLGTNGTQDAGLTTGTGFNNTVISILVQPTDGKIVLGGDFTSYNGTSNVGRLVRLTTGGVLDTASFTTGTAFNSTVNAIAIQSSDSALIAVGTFANYNGTTRAGVARLSSGGTLDSTFNPVIRRPGQISVIEPLPNGQWLVGGFFQFINDVARNHIARFNADGTLDTTFFASGTQFDNAVLAGTTQGDGKFVLGGAFTSFSGTSRTGVARLNADGTLDTSFNPGTGGTQVLAMQIQRDGRIVIGGSFTAFAGATRTRIARLNTDGSLDTTFDPAGTGIGGNVNALALQLDGKIVVGGAFTSPGNDIVRLTTAGAVDTFNSGGTSFSGTVNALTILPDDRILASGSFTSYNSGGTTTTVNRIAALKADGTLDTSFVATTGFTSTVTALAVQSDNKVVGAGYFGTVGGTAHPLFGRVSSGTGAVDNTFTLSTPQGSIYANINVLRFGPDGTLLYGTNRIDYSDTSPGGSNFGLLELAPVPTINTQPVDVAVGPNGTATFTVAASGAALQYQWLKNGATIANATSASYSIANVQPSDVANYSVTITNAYGSVTSSTVTITASNAAPTISLDLVDQALTVGQLLSLSVNATSSGTLTYQWRRSGVAVPGATTSTYTRASVSRTDADYYDVQVYDGLAVTNSKRVRVTVAPTAYPQAQILDPAFSPLLETTGSTALINKIIPAPGNKYIAVGEFRSVSTNVGGTVSATLSRVARFNSDGSLDPTFAPTANGNSALLAVGVQTLGANANKVLISGPISVINNGTDTRRLVRLNSNGTFDPNDAFNTDSGVTSGTVNALVVQPDDKVLVAGTFTFVNSATRNRIVRFNADGTVDGSFFADVNGTINAMVLQSDGKILIGGTFLTVDGQARTRIARLNASGSLDNTFNPVVGGVAPAGPDNTVNAIALTVDGSNKILIGGTFTSYNGNAVTRFARLNADGSFDAGLQTFSGTVLDIACFADGSMLVAGSFTSVNGVTTATASGVTISVRDLVRLTSTGAIDMTFNIGTGTSSTAGLNGQVTSISAIGTKVLLGGSYGTINGTTHASIARADLATGALDANVNPTLVAHSAPVAVAALPNNQLLIGGSITQVNGTPRFNLARINATTGQLDTTFNAGTTSATSIGGTVNGFIVRGDGKIVIAGSFTNVGSTTINRIARLNATDGTLDTGFTVGTGLNNTPSFILQQPDGKLIVGGNNTTFTYNGTLRNGLVRLLPDGALDTTFAPQTFGGAVNAAALQPDGKIVVVGSFTTINGLTAMGVARLNSGDGSLDSTFNVGTGPGTPSFSAPNAVAVQDDGSILIGGSFTSVAGQARTRIARLTSTGAVDSFVVSDGGPTGTVNGFLLQENGSILVRGVFSSVTNGVPNSFTAIRYLPNGTRDTSLIAEGLGSTNGFVILDNGSLITVGTSFANFADTRRSIARFIPGTALSITTQPQSLAVNAGQPATFSVAAAGTAPISYQWLKNGDDIVGATNATYTITGADPLLYSSDTFSVAVSNVFGTITSNSATLTVNSPPVIVGGMPASQTIDPSGTISLNVKIVGTSPVMYQWSKDGVPIMGATNATLVIPSAQASDAGSYTVAVTNSAGSTAPANLKPLVGSWLFSNAFAAHSTGVITFLPTGRFLMAEDGDTTADPSGKDGMEDGAFTWNPATGAFGVTIYNQTNGGWGLSALGAGATLNLNGDTLTLTNGASVTTLTRVLPSATNPLVGAWCLDDPGTVVTFLDDGRYFIAEDGEADFGGGPGMERGTFAWNSSTGQLTTTVVTDTNGDWGFSNPTGGVNTLRLAGDTLTFVDQGGFAFARRVRPAETVVSISTKPIIAATPASAALALGGSTTLSVTAAGTGPFTYQWRKNGAAIGGATNSTLPLTNVTTGDFARYDVVVSSAAGSTTSAAASVSLTSAFIDEAFRPPFFSSASAGTFMTVLSDGSVLQGNAALNTSLQRMPSGPMVRYLADGTRDMAFDFNFPAEQGNASAMTGTADGKFYANTYYTAYGNAANRSRLARYFNNGTLDASFTPIEYDRPTTTTGEIRQILVLSDGNLLVSGFFRDFAGTGRAGIVRISSTGVIDTTFTVTTMSTAGSGVWTMPVIDSNGKILIAGDFTSFNGATLPGIARLNADGTLDPSFAPYGFSRNTAARGLVVQSSGKIVLGGRFTVAGAANIPFIRLNTDGGLDSSFFMDPIDPLSGQSSAIRAMIALPGDRFAATGFSVYVRTVDGVPDTSFAPPQLSYYSASNVPEAYSIVRQNDGTFVVAGIFDTVNSLARPNLVKLDATGAVQPFTAEMWGAQMMPFSFTRTDSAHTVGTIPTGSRYAPNGYFDLLPDGTPATTPFSATLSGLSQVDWIAAGSDGKIFAIGRDANGALLYRRVLPDGSADATLTVTTPTAGFLPDRAYVQPDGKTLVMTRRPSDQAVADNALMFQRLNLDGSPDTGYNPVLENAATAVRGTPAAGESVGALQTITELNVEVLTVDASNRAYVRYAVNGNAVRLVRLNADGSRDTSFATITAPTLATAGTATVTDLQRPTAAAASVIVNNGSRREFRAVVAQPDGKIVIGGQFSSLTINGTPMAVPGIARLNADGSIDSTFAMGAGLQWTISPLAALAMPAVEGMSRQADGKIVVSGNFEAYDGVAVPGIMRLNTDGTRDTTFTLPIALLRGRTLWSEMYSTRDGSIYFTGGYALTGERYPRGLVRIFSGPPSISLPPLPVVVTAGASATLSVTASGPTPLSYQWLKGSNPISGATNATYSIAVTTPNDAGNYSVVVTSPSGSVTSTPVSVTINYAPVITTPPANQSVIDGAIATFTVAANGVPAPTYLWRRNGTPISGATSTSYTTPALTLANNGDTYAVVVSNTIGNSTPSATLTVLPAAPVNATISATFGSALPLGGSNLLNADVTSGSAPLAYAWKRNGSPVIGASSASLLIRNATAADAGTYSVVVSNAAGAAPASPGFVQQVTTEAGWTPRNPLPDATALSSAAFINGQFIVGGTRGSMLFSTDGVNWERRPILSASNIGGVAFGGGTYVAFGSLGSLYSSSDAMNWTPRNSGISIDPSTPNLGGIAYGNGRFVLVYGNGLTSTSTDGITWTAGLLGITDFTGRLTFANGKFYVGGIGVIYSSTDGQTWASSGLPITAGVNQVAYNGTRFVGVGGSGLTLASSDGATWATTTAVTSKNLQSVIAANGQFLAVADDGGILTSPDGLAWTVRTSGTTAVLTGAAFGNGVYVIPENGSLAGILTSTDAVAWTEQSTRVTTANLRAVTANSTGNLAAVGDNGTILFSNSGVIWAAAISGTSANLTDVAFGASTFVAVGAGGEIRSSTNGVSWISQATGGADLNGVKFNNNRFIAVGANGTIRTSADGITWLNRVPGVTAVLNSAAFGAGVDVVVGASGTISTAADGGTDWTIRTSGTTAQLNDVVFAGGQFVAVGNGVALTSPDGIAWTNRTFTSDTLTSVTYAGGFYLATATASGGAASTTYWVSADGIAWSARLTGTQSAWADMAVSGSQVYAVGSVGTIVTAGAPVVSTPVNRAVALGGTATFQALASASPTPVTYQWQKKPAGGPNFSDIAGATTTTLSLASIAAGDNGDYRLVATNAFGSTPSAAATLTVLIAPSITTQPVAALTVVAPQAASFSVVATGSPAPSYQWFKGANAIGDATNATLTISPTSSADSDSYTVRVTNSVSSVTSSPASVLTVNITPTILTPPMSQTVTAGQPVTFAVAANGVPPTTFQWKRNGSPIGGATGMTYTIPATVAGDNNAVFTVDVTNAVKTITSDPATLTVNFAPTVAIAPATLTVTGGQPAAFTATVTGNPAPTLQWRKNTNPIGVTTATYSIASTVAGDEATYDVVATNSVSSATSNSATLVVNFAPVVTSTRTDVVANLGGSASFTVTATGKPTPTYQWRKGSTNITGATNATLSLTNLVAGDAATYSVVVTNSVSSVTFTAGALSFNPALASFSPAAATVGSTVTINGVGLTGASAVKFNGVSATTFTVVSDTQITATVPNFAITGPITVTTAGGATLTSATNLTVTQGPRLVNESIRTTVGSGEQALMASFTIEGGITQSILIRAIGPTLASFGVSGAIADPMITLYDATGATIAVNDNWGGGTDLSNAFATVGAFALSSSSKDAALLANLAPGTYTVRVTPVGTTSGEALLEVYDVSGTGRVPHLSTRAVSGGNLTTGFVLGGTGTSGNQTLLVRAVGAGLGLPGTVANPVLNVMAGSTTIATNDNWATSATLTTATAAAGAMPLATNDSALIVTLPAGAYTAVVTGGVGVASTEIFIADGYRAASFSPALLGPLQNQILTAGTSATFTAPYVAKPGSVVFTWKKNGNPISGATNQTYTIASATATDAGNYSVSMTNSAGTTNSNVATLGVLSVPAITTQPVARTITAGQTATFTVVASGFPVPTYQWRRNGLDITGATDATLTLTNVAFDGGGAISVVATNNQGSATSNSVALTVNPVAPSITSPATASGVLGRSFSYQINANTTQATYGATGLPAGLSIDTTTGVISGTPTATGTFSVSLTAQNVSGTSPKTLSLTIQPPPPIINSAASASGRVNVPFTFAVAAVNNPTSFGATGLPTGLSINTTSGAISGTPSVAGTFTATLSATNSGGTSTSQFVLTIDPALNAPVYSGTTLLSGVQNSTFSFTPVFNTSGLTTTYTATGLPTGVTINASTGVISGTPSGTGSFTATVTATSSGGATSTTFTFTVNSPPTAPVISSASSASGAAGSGFSFQLVASGTPTSYAATGLPALGLSLNTGSGAITGTPTGPGTLTLQVSAANGVGSGPKAALVITINPSANAPIIDSASAVQGKVNDPFSVTLHASNTPTSFAMTSGALPPGLSLTANSGQISGTPTQVGQYSAWFAASNASGPGYALQVNFTIAPAATTPVVNSNGTAAGQVGQPFSYIITATNTPTSFAATGLPAGLTLNTATGAISGLPADATTTALSISLTATNASGVSNPKVLSLTIAPAPATPVITSALSVSAQVGAAFTYQATGSDNATSFVALNLPAGLSLNSTSGQITGTPTVSGTFNVTLRASNAAGLGTPSTLVIQVAPAASAPAITSVAAASGTVGTSFTYTITVSGTATSYGLTGSLPLGLALNTSTGIISGNPAASGVFTVQLTATGAGGTSLPQTLVLNIAPAANAPVITSAIYASATVGQSFTYQISAASTPAFPSSPFPAPFTLDAVNLPAGLGVNPSTGVIQGQPTTAGVFTASLVGTNSAGTGPTRDLTIFIAPAATAPTVTSSPFASGQVGTSFSYQIAGTNTPTSFDVQGAPAWMAINTATGTLAGMPTTPGTFTLQLVATNAAGSSNPQSLTLTIASSPNAPVITSTRTDITTVSAIYSYEIKTAVPTGAPPVTSYVATGLPAGLTLTGAFITGAPTQSGQFEIALIARSTAGDSQPVTLILTINPSFQLN